MASTLFVFWLIFYILVDMYDASIEIVAGWFHNCVFEPGQRGMKCWGYNGNGQLGYGDTNNRGDEEGEMGANLPIVELGPDFIINATSLGRYHSCAVSQEHAVKCWGWGRNYQTGHATNNDLGGGAGEMGVNLAFVEFRVDFVPLKVAAGQFHSCVLSTDALLVCFGYNGMGQCGAGTSDNSIIGPPSNIADVDLGSNFTPIDIATFYDHVCAISQQQTIKCFGNNLYGQLGYGDTTTRGLTPQSMGDGLPVLILGSNFIPKAMATGVIHTCALSTLKTVKCFGRNNYGQCGQVTPGGTNNDIGDAANEMDDNLPVIVFPDGFVPMQMTLGFYHTCVLSESAQIVCFGRNDYGQLGLGHTSSTTSRTLVDLGTDFIPRKITAGQHHTCAVSTGDTVKCWGKTDFGQLGLGHANNIGDQANEMGDDLPIVDLQYTAATARTTEAPTSVALTSAAPTTATLTTTGPTTATPTTITTTAESETTHANNSDNNHTVTVTIRTDSLSSTQEESDAQSPKTSAKLSWKDWVIAILGSIVACVCCVAAVGLVYVRRHRNKQHDGNVVPGAAADDDHDDDDERKQGEEDVELEMASQEEAKQPFVYDENRNYKKEGARASLVTAAIHPGVVAEEKSENEDNRTPGNTIGATVGNDPNLGVYELKHMVDL